MYKTEYSKTEMEDVIAWFREHRDSLPEKLDINDATHTDNLPATIDAIIASLAGCDITPVLSGLAYRLFEIKERLENK